MIDNKIKTKFFVVEGVDGSGKTIISKRVAEELNMMWTCEPSEKFKLSKDPFENLYRFAIDRYIHNRDVIIPALCNGDGVICDRYWLSTLVYQGLDEFISDSKWDEIIHLAIPINSPKVQTWFILHPNINAAVNRCSKRGEMENFIHLNRLDINYIVYPQKLSMDNVVHIDTEDKTIEDLSDMIVNIINMK